MMRSRRLRTLARALAAMAVGLSVLTAVIGFAHTRAGAPLLAWMGRAAGVGRSAGGCPLGYDRAATPAQNEAARAAFGAAHRGDERAGSRPALGFDLDRTTRDDVVAWASSHHLSCAAARGPADLSCERVPEALLPPGFRGVGAETVWFVFGSGERLISVTAIARAASPVPVSATFASITGNLDREVGAPAKREGDGSPSALASGLLYQASAEYRFRDYYAVTRATNTGHGYSLTEEYRSLAD